MNGTIGVNTFPAVPVTPTHQLRVLTGTQAGEVYAIAFERVRVGRPYNRLPHEFRLDDALAIVGRGMHVFSDGNGGHLIQQIGAGIPPFIDGRRVGDECPYRLHDGVVIRIGPVKVVYERLPDAPLPFIVEMLPDTAK